MTSLTNLPSGATVSSTDEFYAVQTPGVGGVKVTASQIKSFVGGSGSTFYISSAGSDANSGTSPSSPWLTIAKVNAQTPSPGAAFLFRAGDTFSGSLVVAASGNATLPIIYGSYDDNQTEGTNKPANAIISSGTSGGFTSTDNSFITVQNLTFTGSGPTTNAHGINFIGANSDGSGLTVQNCIINGYGYNGVYFVAGANPSPIVYLSNCNVNGNTIYNVGQNGIQFATGNPINTNNALAFVNVTVQNNKIYDITGQNSVFGAASFNGAGISIQGCDQGLVQNNLVHDCGSQSTASGFQNNPGLYCATNSNMTWQYNEVYNIGDDPPDGSNSGDAGGITIDFGNHYILCQYNYFHDNFSYGIALFGSGFVNGITNIQNNITIRYNILANNGAQNGGIANYCFETGPLFSASAQINNTFIYNNTFYGTGLSVGLMNFSGVGSETNYIFYNNLFIADAKSQMGNHATGTPLPFFINNAYIGANPITAGSDRGSNYSTITAWLNALGAEILNGAQQTILTGPPGTAKLAGPEPIVTAPNMRFDSAAALGTTVTQSLSNTAASKFCLQQSSPYATAGIDGYTILPTDLIVPGNMASGNVDFDFKGQSYSGDVIGSISCSRTSTLATDLLPDDPMGRAFNTFGANTLRITAGRGLLIEEARHQYLSNPGTPATQTTGALTAGSYVLWVNGFGSASITAGSGGTPITAEAAFSNQGIVASHGRPAPFLLTTSGTVVVTVTGSLNQFQLESDPLSSRYGTSFINGTGDRDADVVTSTTGTTFGLSLNRQLSGNGFNAFWMKDTTVGYPFGQTRTLVADNSTTSGCYLQTTNSQIFGVTKVGSVTANTATIYPPFPKNPLQNNNGVNNRSTFLAISDPSAGQSVSANGESYGVNATTASPTTTSPMHIGNDVSKNNSINGYIERIVSGSLSISGAAYQNMASAVPIAAINLHPPATKDFFGNPVPGPSGLLSIGAHQPSTTIDVASLDGADQLVSGGANVTELGLATGNVTIDCGARPLQSITNGGAFTITAPTTDGSCILLVTNNASASTISFSGFSVSGTPGDSLDTTNGHKFSISIWRINGVAGYRVAAHQ